MVEVFVDDVVPRLGQGCAITRVAVHNHATLTEIMHVAALDAAAAAPRRPAPSSLFTSLREESPELEIKLTSCRTSHWGEADDVSIRWRY